MIFFLQKYVLLPLVDIEVLFPDLKRKYNFAGHIASHRDETVPVAL